MVMINEGLEGMKVFLAMNSRAHHSIVPLTPSEIPCFSAMPRTCPDDAWRIDAM
jgi:hypothetical protein